MAVKLPCKAGLGNPAFLIIQCGKFRCKRFQIMS